MQGFSTASMGSHLSMVMCLPKGNCLNRRFGAITISGSAGEAAEPMIVLAEVRLLLQPCLCIYLL
jgi:hypothetical protein